MGERLHRCGYVGVDKSHPLFGVMYDQQTDKITREMVDRMTIGKRGAMIAITANVRADDDQSLRRSPDILLDVHGGITFSSGNKSFNQYYPVKSDLWWFGFDCGHCDDGIIEPSKIDIEWNLYKGEVRSLEYVEAECESLASQLAMMVGVPITQTTNEKQNQKL